MPYLPDGIPLLDIVLNPLGVPSRMNIGQVLEVHLGYAAQALGWKVATPTFNGANETTIREPLRQAGLREDGKSTSCTTAAPVRSSITTSPSAGSTSSSSIIWSMIRSMPVPPAPTASSLSSLWAAKPSSAASASAKWKSGRSKLTAQPYTLQEILTVKSDDVTGRVKTYEAIVKGNNIPQPGVPESFKVLIKELQSLCLDIRVLDKDGNEIELKDDDEDDFIPDMKDELYTMPMMRISRPRASASRISPKSELEDDYSSNDYNSEEDM